MPPNTTEPHGLGFVMIDKVGVYYASDTVTIRPRTGFLVWLNFSLIHWFSNKNIIVESSRFGSEFVAMNQCYDYLRGIRYNLRMMVIPCDGPSYIEGDNKYVLANTTIPGYALNKKNKHIAYHFLREGYYFGEWRTIYVNTHYNEAYLLK